MSESMREIEGTWEEVVLHDAELCGHHVRLTILDENGADHSRVQETASPRGSFARIEAGLSRFPADHDENRDIWEVIASERTVWRKMAQEKREVSE